MPSGGYPRVCNKTIPWGEIDCPSYPVGSLRSRVPRHDDIIRRSITLPDSDATSITHTHGNTWSRNSNHCLRAATCICCLNISLYLTSSPLSAAANLSFAMYSTLLHHAFTPNRQLCLLRVKSNTGFDAEFFPQARTREGVFRTPNQDYLCLESGPVVVPI